MDKMFTPALKSRSLLHRFLSRVFLLLLLLGAGKAQAQTYCTPTNTGTQNNTYYTDNFTTSGALVNISNLGTGLSGGAYGDFTTLSVSQVQTRTVSFTAVFGPAGNTFGFGVWVDWNQDGDFTDAGEKVFTSNSYQTSHSGTFTVPATAAPGNTRMRIGSSWSPSSGPASSCAGSQYIEFEDYTFNVVALTPCAGTPVANITSSIASTCPNTPFTLLASPNTQSGLTYLYEKSIDGGVTWTTLTTSTNPAYTVTNQTVATQYRVTVTCAGSSNTSAPISVAQNPPNVCYCVPSSTSTFYYINNFSTTGGASNISNLNSGISPGGYGQFQAQDVSQVPGQTVNFSASFGSGTYGFSIWVDWNQDGDFSDAGEKVFTNTTGSYQSSYNNSFTVPTTALTGPTRMRIVADFFDTDPNIPCETGSTSAEFEDYTFITLPPCTGAPATGLIVSSPAVPCLGDSITLSIPNGTYASDLGFRWEYNDGNGSGWLAGTSAPGASTDTTRSFGARPIGLTYYRVTVKCRITGDSTTSDSIAISPLSITMPYFEDFESIGVNNELPPCMKATDIGGKNLTFITPQGVGRRNHTPGGSKYGSFALNNGSSGGSSAQLFFTPGLPLRANVTYAIKYWYVGSGTTSLVTTSTFIGATPTPAAMTTQLGTINGAADTNYKQAVYYYTPSTSGVYFVGISNFNLSSSGYLSIDDIQVDSLPPCSGAPAVATIISNTAGVCPGTQLDLELTGYTVLSNLSYQWTRNSTPLPGSTSSPFYTTDPLTTAIDTYRVELTCNDLVLGPITTISTPLIITPYKATIPYIENFESITATNELPTCFTVTNLNSGTFTLTSPASSNHTPGGSKYAAFGVAPTIDEWMFTPMMTLQGGLTYKFSFWYRTSTATPFPILQATVGSGPTPAQVTTLIDSKVNAGTTTYQQFVCLYTVPANGTGDYSFGINTNTNGLASAARLLIDDIQVDSLPKCTSKPNIAVTPAGPIFQCPTDSFTLNAPLATNSGFDYMWERTTDTVTTGPFQPIWVDAPGTNNTIKYSANAPLITHYYRLRTICTFTNDTGYSNVVGVVVNTTQYKPLPYVTDLENWVNNCSNKDVPADSNWLQIKRTGNSSWRRYDQGNTANWTAPTAGTYAPQAHSQLYSARFHSSRAATAAGPNDPEEGTLDLYLDCNTGPGTSANKALYFYHISPGAPTNALDVRISTNGTFQTIASFDSADNWRLRRIPFVSNGGNTIIRFAGRRTANGTGGSDIGIDSIFVAAPCSGQPVAGTIGAVSPTSICPGDTAILNLTGTSMAGDLQIEWETSTTSATGPFTSQTPNGRGGYSWSSGQLMQTTWVRAKVTCGGTGDVDSTNVVAFNLNVTPGITYATLPVTENFESWTDRCGLREIPSANWANVPSFGNRSWRRNDQGTAGAWTNITAGQWWPATPVAAVDSYAARFHNAAAGPDGSLGALNLYVNCNTGTPTVKELRFFVNMSDRTAGNTDTLRVLYSLDGGFTFTKLDTIRSTNGWEQKVYALPSDSSKTIIRFEAYSQTSQEDIGLDYVQVLNPCSGTPVAGTVNPVPDQCPGRTFRLSATGTSAQGGLNYFWESSTTSATTGFSPVGGRQQSVLDTNITQNTWFRLVVACGTSTPLDTSAAILVKLADTFHCYCVTNAQYPYVTSQFKENIGRITLKDAQGITMMANGVATPITNNPTAVNAYSNLQNMPATPLYRDSTYTLDIQQISYTTNASAKVVGWIDFNRDGVFDPITEQIANLTTTAGSSPVYRISGNFTVPSNAKPGITGMRVTLQQPDNGTLPDPCGTFDGYGETEDYLVDLLLAPCSGFTTLGGGTAFISDTSICPGYPVTLWDTGYQKEISGVTRLWQQSTNNGVSWQAVGPQNRDSIDVIVQANTRYRFVLLCSNGVESYSNVVSTFLRPATECYCPSYADGGPNQLVTNMDSSDIGSFSIGNYTFQVGGPHLINPQATRKWTNNAGIAQTIELWADSTYNVDIYQIMRGTNHKDVKVTMFIDYNHDLQFDVNPPNGYPSERVLTTFTSASNYYLDNLQLTIPAAQVLTTGTTLLRIVMNENTSPNPASDNGCGTYMSGETEDYYVTFRCPTCPTGVQNANGNNVSSFNLFPNPTTGLATVELRTVNAVKEMEMTITNMTGQVIQKRSFGAQGTQFSTTVDLKDQARGVYFVELKADNERIVRKLVVQ